MLHRSRYAIALVVALAAPVITAAGPAASALSAPTKGGPASAARNPQAGSAKLDGATPLGTGLKGYQQVVSDDLVDPAGDQVSGTVSCPVGTDVVGGGVVISGTDLDENVNSSIPLSDGSGWLVYVNNASGVDGTFRVEAVCAQPVLGYTIAVNSGIPNRAGTQSEVGVKCPHATYPLGGGGLSSSGSTAVNLNLSIPLTKGWRVDVNNASTGTDTISAYAVCGAKPGGYLQVFGPTVFIPAMSQGSASVTCPSGTLVFGGGGYSSGSATSVDLNSTLPTGLDSWQTYENNGSPGQTALAAYAVCGKAKFAG